jgi:predicted CXXCH cytochrome family protein
LKGAHARVGCEKCHRAEKSEETRVIRYNPLPTECVSCHDSPRPLEETSR